MDNNILNKSEIKAKRVKEVFVNTTKQMIIDNGIDNISTRKIADNAGYAFATLYNHFKDLDELLMLTRDSIIDDVASYLLSNTINQTGENIIKHTFKSYIDYCINYPNAFKFFFLYTQKEKKKDFSDINSFHKLGSIFTDAFSILGSEYKIGIKSIQRISNTIFYSVHGMLIVHLSNNFDLTTDELYSGLDDTLEILLKNYNLEV